MANIVIVGGGVAGLSAGIYGRISGHNVTIYEKHYLAGGNLTGWNREGYHIDNCIHWLTGTNPNTSLYKMWEELGVLGNVKVYQGDSLYTFDLDNNRISLSNDINKLEEDMLNVSSNDEKEIKAFIKAIKAVQGISGIGGIDNSKKSGFLEIIRESPILYKYYKMNTGELANRFSSPLLKGFIESLISEKFSALALIIVFATYTGKNGGIPGGSSCEMARRMKERFLKLGGKLVLGKEVSEIKVKNKKATSFRCNDEEISDFDYLIVTGDLANAFNKLLDYKYLPTALKKRYRDERLLRFSTYHCAFSCELEKLDFKGDLIFEVPDKDQEIIKSKYLILREFSHEKSFSPSGKNILQTMVYCVEKDCLEFIELSKNKKAYQDKKRRLSDCIKEIIINKLPYLKDKIQCIDVWTPATYKRYTGAEVGSFMSFALPARYLPLKITNRVKGIDNVILASQWLTIPGGLPLAAEVGKKAIETINKI